MAKPKMRRKIKFTINFQYFYMHKTKSLITFYVHNKNLLLNVSRRNRKFSVIFTRAKVNFRVNYVSSKLYERLKIGSLFRLTVIIYGA